MVTKNTKPINNKYHLKPIKHQQNTNCLKKIPGIHLFS